jgi:tRNA threonylcarbamoyladenosine biosynthesis protein TsaB
MNILAVDTASRRAGFALVREGRVAASLERETPDGFGAMIFQAITELLEREGLPLAGIDCYAAARGPGSFTGVRVGLAAVKALAEAHGKRVVTVSNLEALASAGSAQWRVPVLPGRNGDVFAALYGADLVAAIEPLSGPWPRFLTDLRGRGAEFLSAVPGLLDGAGAAPAPPGAQVRLVTAPLAELTGLLAARRFAAGAGLPPEAIDAEYVRRPYTERGP